MCYNKQIHYIISGIVTIGVSEERIVVSVPFTVAITFKYTLSLLLSGQATDYAFSLPNTIYRD